MHGIQINLHITLGLLEAFARAGGKGVAAPSANRFGIVSPFLIVRRHLGHQPRNYQCVVEGFLSSLPLLLDFKLFTSPTCDCPDRGQGGNY